MTEFASFPNADQAEPAATECAVRLYFGADRILDEYEVEEIADQLDLEVFYNQSPGPAYFVHCAPEELEAVEAVLDVNNLWAGMRSRRQLTVEDIPMPSTWQRF